VQWYQAAGWIIEAFVVVPGIAFAIISICEKENRAAFVSFILTIVAGCVWAGVVMFSGELLPYFIWGAAAIGAVSFIAVMLPVGKSRPLSAGGRQERVDERDVIFSRANMKPEHHDKYYERCPELKALDDELRSLPELGAPGGRYYDRANAEIMNSMFAWIEDIGHLTEGEVSGDKVEISPGDAALRLKGFAKALGAELVGVTRLNQAYVYSHVGRGLGEFGSQIKLEHEYAIAFAVEMRREYVKQAPTIATILETCKGYVECATIGELLARYIRSLGYPATAHIDANYRVMCVPIAADAGLGELSRMGYLITDKLGPRVRLGVVTTDMEMKTDEPINLGVQDFCVKCKKCAYNCPSGAIPLEDDLKDVKGAKKWELDREACYKFWLQSGTDCGICMSVCTFSKPANPMHNFIRFLIKRNSLARRIAVIGDDLLYGKRPRSAKMPDWMKAGM